MKRLAVWWLAAAACILYPAACRAEGKAVVRYVAADSDFVAIQEGITAAQTVQPELFPHGINDIDIILFDARNIFVFSRNGAYKMDHRGEIKDYQIYVANHAAKLTENDMSGCFAGGMNFISEVLPERVPRNYVACAPWGAVQQVQTKRNSIYVTKESYYAMMIHSFARQYMDQELWQIPFLLDVIAKVRSIKTFQPKRRIVEEAFATWCELRATQEMYPDHFVKLSHGFQPSVDEPGNWAIKVGMELLPPFTPTKRGPD